MERKKRVQWWVVVDWWWVIGRRCDGDNVLLVPDETTWMDGRLDIIRGRHAVGPTCSLLWREHVRTCHARNGRVESLIARFQYCHVT